MLQRWFLGLGLGEPVYSTVLCGFVARSLATQAAGSPACPPSPSLDPVLESLLSDLEGLVPPAMHPYPHGAPHGPSHGRGGGAAGAGGRGRAVGLRALQAGLLQHERARLASSRWYHHAAMAGG